MTQILFYVFAAMAIGGALGVVLQKNPLSSLLMMVGTLASIAAIFVLMDAHFLAAIQVLVYAGAIMVLFLFVIMLLNLGHDYRKDIKTGAGLFMGFALCGVLGGILWRQLGGAADSTVLQAFPGPEGMEQLLEEEGIVGAIARPLFTDHVVLFELTGILLLVALVGAVAIAKRRV